MRYTVLITSQCWSLIKWCDGIGPVNQQDGALDLFEFEY